MAAAVATTANPDGPPPSQLLLDEFRPFLDESVILAIIGDYDDLAANVDTARSTLAVLAESAWVEEAYDFNPSGVGSDEVPSESQQGAQPEVTDPSVFSDVDQSLSPSMSDSSPELLPAAVLEGLDVGDVPDDDKLPTLYSMFPEIKPFDISFELKRAAGDFDRALAALLTIQYLDETGELQRGTIDAAFSPESQPAGRKKGKKNKKATPAENSKAKLRLDLHYRFAPLSLQDSDDVPASTSVGRSPLLSPISLVPSSRSSPAPQAGKQLAQPPAQPPNPTEWQKVAKRKKSSPAAASRPVVSPSAPERSTMLRSAAADSFGQAHAAWRRGKSDPLHRPVAVIYAERGHALAEVALARERAEHEDLVDRQSRPGVVDLHGVTVRSGVEIALERTREWWQALGCQEAVSRNAAAKRDPIIVVTGAGKHSVGGVSRLRQAIGSALARDGWIIEAQTGQYVVSGRKKAARHQC